MEVWQTHHIVEIPQSVQDEMTPSRDCLALAQELVWGYTRVYPEEHWPLVVCEEPLVFPLEGGSYYCEECNTRWSSSDVEQKLNASLCPVCRRVVELTPELQGLAKIDTYFYVLEVTTIPSGLPGKDLTLTPGWWIHEYKTKSPAISPALYLQSWESGMQASYQLTALNHHVQKQDPMKTSLGVAPVQGVLVNVLEKPRKYTPKRKCKKCDEMYEFYLWIPTGTGEYRCPVCGSSQKLQALKETPKETPPVFYRELVMRTPRQLERDREIMVQTGHRMQQMEREGLYSQPWTKSNCVSFQWRRACDYFSAHQYERDTREDDQMFETKKDYRMKELVQIGGGE